jgi:hypothetical protein
VVLVKGSGGIVDMLIKRPILKEIGELYAVVDSAERAVTQALSFIK